jgi:hypothetical protein
MYIDQELSYAVSLCPIFSYRPFSSGIGLGSFTFHSHGVRNTNRIALSLSLITGSAGIYILGIFVGP